MYAPERHHEILSLARQRGRVDVGSLAEKLGVTVETVRRDLTALERLGEIRRVHGGALPVECLPLEPSLAIRESKAMAEKRRIAERAIEEIPQGATVLLDSGSTALAIADALPAELSATIITNSVSAAAKLAGREGLEIMILGGRVRHRTGAAVGEWLAQAVQGLVVDVALLGTNGFSLERGFTTPDQAEASAKRAMVEAGRRVVIVSDSSKAGRVHLHRFAAPGEVAMLITDSNLDDDTVADFDDAGVEVVRA
jgi:DeoR family fructose operon transcriptional repressor